MKQTYTLVLFWIVSLLLQPLMAQTQQADFEPKEQHSFRSFHPTTTDYTTHPISLPNQENWFLAGDLSNQRFGENVSSAGDMNGDGYSDLLVGQPWYSNGEAKEGRILLYLGSASGLSYTAAWSYESNIPNAELGYSLSNAGDLNGDGHADIVAGAPSSSQGGANAGSICVFYGSDIGLPSSVSWTYTGSRVDAAFGYSIALLGDVNKDGFSDLAVGSPYYTDNFTGEGAVSLFLGSSTGLSSPEQTITGRKANANFGFALSSAGDVNGDGFFDMIVGAPGFEDGQVEEGAALLYLGNSNGVSANPNWLKEGEQAYARYGYSVSFAGDMNGDGYSDVMIGAPSFSGNFTHEGAVFCYAGSATGLANTTFYAVQGDSSQMYLGRSLAMAGDVNGDGLSDILLSLPGTKTKGAVKLLLGNPLSVTESWYQLGTQDSSWFGYTLASAGDVNGDGYSDVVISTPFFDQAGLEDVGAIWVYHGEANSVVDSVGWMILGSNTNEQLGEEISCAGDVNGDGYSDILICSPHYSDQFSLQGKVLAYYGGKNGFSSTPDWAYTGSGMEENLGHSASGAGDVNGDGYSDIVIGVPGFSDGEAAEGKVLCFLGSSNGLESSPSWAVASDHVNAQMGSAVAGAGDVNGDGLGDVLVGLPSYSSATKLNAGAVWLFLGSDQGLERNPAWMQEGDIGNAGFGNAVACAGDVNGDGLSDAIVGSYLYDNANGKVCVYYGNHLNALSDTASWSFVSPVANAYAGYAVASAGDVNGDGYADVLVGSPFFSDPVAGLMNSGAVAAFYGSANGPNASPNWIVLGESNGDFLGIGLGHAGDVNGDGYSDVVFGSPLHSSSLSDQGKVYVYNGSPTGLDYTPSWSKSSGVIGSYFGGNVAGAGDVNGDGFSDLLVGAKAYGTLAQGAAMLFYGNSVDGLPVKPRQYMPGTSIPLWVGGLSETNGSIRLGLFAKSPEGRAKASLVWEYTLNGQAFSSSASSLANSVQFTGNQSITTDLGIAGTELKEDISGVSSNGTYKWRARLAYDPVLSLNGQVYSPWRYASILEPDIPLLGFRARSNDSISSLPVDWVDFDVRWDPQNPENALLEWQTASESNNDYFAIERSHYIDAWEQVGIISGQGNSNSVQAYSFTDESIGYYMAGERVYYRIKQVDFDGELSYSNIEMLKLNDDGRHVKVWPTHIQDQVHVLFYQSVVSGSVSIMDSKGKLVYHQDISTSNQRETMHIQELDMLPDGLYFVQVVTDDAQQSIRIVKQTP